MITHIITNRKILLTMYLHCKSFSPGSKFISFHKFDQFSKQNEHTIKTQPFEMRNLTVRGVKTLKNNICCHYCCCLLFLAFLKKIFFFFFFFFFFLIVIFPSIHSTHS
ncbi:hypothetical protein X975_12184, partial [Stegodyphus mimosarum]